MAKKPGPVAGSLGNTEYYYKSDGTVVDESGIPASARISAMFAAPPVVEAVAIKNTQQKLKKNNAQLAGVLKNTKYYFAPDGSSIVDDRGLSAPAPIAKAFLKDREEKRQSIAAVMAYATSTFAPKQTVKETESKVRTEKFNNILATSADKLNASNDEMNKLYPVLFKNLNSVIARISENHEILARQLVEQNQNFQDAVVEQLTGTKGPTKSGGSSGKRAKGAKGIRGNRTKYVKDRADRINSIRQEKNKKALGAFAPILGGLIAAGTIALTGAGNDKSEITPDVPRGGGGTGNNADSSVPTNPSVQPTLGAGKEGAGRKAAEQYYGKALTDQEYDQLIRATHAESGSKSDAQEQAMIMGSILNRARTHPGGIIGALNAKNQFQAVTGTKFAPGPSRNFIQGPNEKRMGSIEDSAASMLSAVPREQKNFTAASSGAYGAGTNIGYRNKMVAGGGTTYGGSVFNTSMRPTGAPSASSSSGTNRSVGNIAGPSVPANLSVQPTVPAGQPSRIGAIQPLDATGAPPGAPQRGTSNAAPSNVPGMVTLTTPGGKSYVVAAQYANNFKGFVEELENSGYKIKSIGGYANRNIAETGTKSYHALGVAIDINPSANPHLKDGRLVTDMPSNIGAIAAKYGLGWGGNWRSSKDAMHFSMGEGEGGSVSIDRSGATPLPGAPGATPAASAAPMGAPQSVPQSVPQAGTGGDLQKYNTKDQSHIAGLNSGFAGKLGQFLAAAEQAGAPIKILSGYRSPERQAQLFQAAVAKYGSPEAARKWVAPPGRSNHGRGTAVDLQYSSGQARGWAHQNAAKFGLYFRMAHEPWHIEPQGGADGDMTPMPGAPSMPQTASLGPLAQRNAMAQNINSMPCPPMIFNNIMNNNSVRTIRQGSSFQQTSRPNPGFNPLAAAIGGVIGNALRGLF